MLKDNNSTTHFTAFLKSDDGFPWFINLVVTPRCNLSCRMCHARFSDLRVAPTQKMLAFIDKLGDWLPRDRRVILTGGEPLLHPDIVEFVQRLKSLGFPTSLCTNGSLLNADLADRLAKARLSRINFSLDGLGEVHDRLRNAPGLFQGVMDMIRYVSEFTDLEIYTTSVISAESADSLPDLVRTLSGNPRIAAMRFQALIPTLWRPYAEQFFQDDPLWPGDPEQLGRVMKAIDSLEKLKNTGLSIVTPAHQFDLWRRYFADPIRFSSEAACNIEEISFQVLPDGSVLHCDCLGRVGDIDDDPKALWIAGIGDEERARIRQCRHPCNYKINCCVI